jgi:hypothetical protein
MLRAGGDILTDHLVGFGRALRQAGLPVSTAEVLAAATAARAAGIADRETFRLALRACLVKDPQHLTPFDRLFAAWFHVPWPATGERRRQPGGKPASRQPTHRGAPTPGAGPPRATPGRQSKPAEPQDRPADRPRPSPADFERPEHERRQEVARARAALEQSRQSQPGRRPLWRRATSEEQCGLEREADRLGRLLRTRLGRRLRRAPHGRPDLRATVARAARTGGAPLAILRRRRRLARPRLLVLCDVSGSVIAAAGLLLRLLRTVARRFDQTTVFVFVDRPIEASPLLRAADPLPALERLEGLDLQASSDFGHVFVKLLADHPALLTRRTSLLVLGDARCNQFDPQVWALDEIARRVAHIVWLNPDRRGRWFTGDCRLAAYQPYLTHLLPAETLEDLAAGLALLAR